MGNNEFIINLFISLFTSVISFILGLIANYFMIGRQEYSEQKYNKVKITFFSSFILSVILILMPDTNYDFLNILVNVLLFFSMSFVFMEFICLIEIINAIKENIKENSADDNKDN